MTIWNESLPGELWLVGISGRLDHEQTPLLEAELNRLLDEEHHFLIIDLSDVTYINSGGLRCLVTIWRQARQKEGDVVLCGLSDRIEQLFKIVGFEKVFNIFDTCSAAQEALLTG